MIQTIEERNAIIVRADAEMAALRAEYDAWNKSQGLDLGSADEHWFDDALTAEQRNWVRDFSNRWDAASIIWSYKGVRQWRDA